MRVASAERVGEMIDSHEPRIRMRGITLKRGATDNVKQAMEHTLLASNVTWTLISPVTDSFSYGRSLNHSGRAMQIGHTRASEQQIGTSALRNSSVAGFRCGKSRSTVERGHAGDGGRTGAVRETVSRVIPQDVGNEAGKHGRIWSAIVADEPDRSKIRCRKGKHALVPLVDRMLVYQHGLDLHSSKES